jgi:hypothetical protein
MFQGSGFSLSGLLADITAAIARAMLKAFARAAGVSCWWR